MDDQRKYEVIKGLIDHQNTANKNRAALILGYTKRHINRMMQGYIKDCTEFFIHCNGSKKPSTIIRLDFRSQVLDLYRTKKCMTKAPFVGRDCFKFCVNVKN